MAKTMEQYMSKTRGEYGSGVARPKIDANAQFELNGQFLKELRDNTFSGSEHEDANEHIKKVVEIVDLFHTPNVTQDQIMLCAFHVSLTGAVSRWLINEPASSITTWEVLKMKFLNKYYPLARTAKKIEEINNFQQEPDESLFRAWERFKELLMKYPQHYLTDMQEVILFYNGLDVSTRQILDSRGAIPTKTAADSKVAIQEMVGCELCKGPHYTKDCPHKEEGKTLKEAYYTKFGTPYQPGGQYRAAGPGFYQRNNENSSYLAQRDTMEESLSKFIAESAKRHEENLNIIKEIRASTDATIRNQGASIKTLKLQIGQMIKVLQERGLGSLPSSTETNSRDQVKSISTTTADLSEIRCMEYGPYAVSVPQHRNVFPEAVPFPKRLHNYCCDDWKEARGVKILEDYDHNLPQKEKDPGSFTLPCFINNVCFDKALVDLGASVSVMPFSTYTNLGLGVLSHTRLTIELADRTIKQLRGIAKNVLVRISKFVFTIDFIILDIPEDDDIPLILGRPFLSTAHIKIDVFKRKASKTKSWLWHRRLSHLNFGAINHLARHGLVRGLPKLKFEKDHLCSACAMGKSKKKPHKPKSEDTNQEKLYLLHMDLCGPMRVASVNGKKYILVIVDDYSRFTWVKFLRSKDEAPDFIIKFLKMIQVRLKVTVRRIRTDNGTEFVNQTLREYYEKIGISHETSVARSPQQNGVVERRNRTLIEAARTMLIYAKALLFLWAEAVATTCYTQNCSIIRLRHGKTPYELLHDKPPDLSFFHVFGALCYPTNDSENLGKLQPKADIGIFIGYAPTKKAFRIYNRRTRRIIETIHVDFDELTAMASEHSSSGPALHEITPATISSGLVPNPPPSTPFVPPLRTDWDILFQPMFDELLTPPPSVDLPAPEVIAPIDEVVAPVPVVSTGSPSSTTVDQDAPSPSNSQTTPETQPPVIPNDVEEDNHDIEVAHMGNDPYFGIPILEIPSDQSSSSDSIHTIVHPDHQISEHNSKWTKDHPLENIIGELDRPVSTRLQLHEQALFCYYDAFLTAVEPKTYKDDLTQSCWIEAMQEELNEFERLKV
ncbi:putative ribonuclease H-like domain-containing protein [Tanacetum coccineum]